MSLIVNFVPVLQFLPPCNIFAFQRGKNQGILLLASSPWWTGGWVLSLDREIRSCFKTAVPLRAGLFYLGWNWMFTGIFPYILCLNFVNIWNTVIITILMSCLLILQSVSVLGRFQFLRIILICISLTTGLNIFAHC